MTYMTSLDENYALHTYNEKGMGMEEWGRKDLGLISQRYDVHDLEIYASHKHEPIINQPNLWLTIVPQWMFQLK